MITKVRTKDMTHEEWLDARRKSIGGSDAGAILGLNSYTSPYALWAEKTGTVIPEDISDKEAVRLGNDLEAYVASRFEEATGKKVHKDNSIIYNDSYPWAHANIDRKVENEDAGLECKTTSSWEILQDCRNGNYPKSWYCQMTHYMAITGYSKWYLAVLVFGHGFFYFEINRNQAEIDALMDSEKLFWEMVQTKTPPAVDGSDSTKDTIRTIFAEDNGTDVDLTAVATNLQCLEALKKQKKSLDAEITEQENIIMDFMGCCAKGKWNGYSVSWTTTERKTFDKKFFEQEHGEIPDKYYGKSTSRTFRFNAPKK